MGYFLDFLPAQGTHIDWCGPEYPGEHGISTWDPQGDATGRCECDTEWYEDNIVAALALCFIGAEPPIKTSR